MCKDVGKINKCHRDPKNLAKLRGSLCFRARGALGGWQNKETSYGTLGIIKNLVQTIGFHHPPFLCKLVVKTVLRRGTLISRWEPENYWKSLCFLLGRPLAEGYGLRKKIRFPGILQKRWEMKQNQQIRRAAKDTVNCRRDRAGTGAS